MPTRRPVRPRLGIVDLRMQAEQDGPPVGPPVERVRIRVADDYDLAKRDRRRDEGVPGDDARRLQHRGQPQARPEGARGSSSTRRAPQSHGLGFEDLATALARRQRRPRRLQLPRSTLADRRGHRHPRDARRAIDRAEPTASSSTSELRARAATWCKLPRRRRRRRLTRGFLSYRSATTSQRAVSVYADVDGRAWRPRLAVNQRCRPVLRTSSSRHPGVSIRLRRRVRRTPTRPSPDTRAPFFPVALLAIYMILAALFRSYLQPAGRDRRVFPSPSWASSSGSRFLWDYERELHVCPLRDRRPDRASWSTTRW